MIILTSNPLKSIPKPALYASLAAAAGIVGYAYYKRRSGGGASASTGPVGADPNIDPATGIPYADEFGSGQGGYSGIGIYDPSTGSTFGTGYGGQTVTQVSTNAAWAQAAEAYLSQVAGYNPNTVAIALGRGLTGQYLNPDQLNIWNAATGFEGYPPQPIPPLVTTPPPGQGGGGGGGTGAGPVTGLHNVHVFRTSVTVGWHPVSGAKGYVVDISGQPHGTYTMHTSINIGGLKPNTSYTVTVTPLKSDGTRGNPAHESVHTKK